MIDGMGSKSVRGDVSCASALTVPMGSTTRAANLLASVSLRPSDSALPLQTLFGPKEVVLYSRLSTRPRVSDGDGRSALLWPKLRHRRLVVFALFFILLHIIMGKTDKKKRSKASPSFAAAAMFAHASTSHPPSDVTSLISTLKGNKQLDTLAIDDSDSGDGQLLFSPVDAAKVTTIVNELNNAKQQLQEIVARISRNASFIPRITDLD
jgi:hypothetical protein